MERKSWGNNCFSINCHGEPRLLFRRPVRATLVIKIGLIRNKSLMILKTLIYCATLLLLAYPINFAQLSTDRDQIKTTALRIQPFRTLMSHTQTDCITNLKTR